MFIYTVCCAPPISVSRSFSKDCLNQARLGRHGRLIFKPATEQRHDNARTCVVTSVVRTLQAREKLGIDVENDWNVGIAGLAGSGKSSLVNAIRGLKIGDQGEQSWRLQSLSADSLAHDSRPRQNCLTAECATTVTDTIKTVVHSCCYCRRSPGQHCRMHLSARQI